jgi:hypothetical protein
MSHIKLDRCDVPSVTKRRYGSIWVCSCGKAWTLQPVAQWEPRIFIVDQYKWFPWPREGDAS